MSPTEQALQKIKIALDQQLDPSTEEFVTGHLDRYYNSKGTVAKGFTVGHILEVLNLKFSTHAAVIAEAIV